MAYIESKDVWGYSFILIINQNSNNEYHIQKLISHDIETPYIQLWHATVKTLEDLLALLENEKVEIGEKVIL